MAPGNANSYDVQCSYITLLRQITFACGPTGAIFAGVMYKYMLSLSEVSKFNKHYFFTEKSRFV